MITQVYAFGHDKFWLDAIQKVEVDNVILKTIHCLNCLSNCLDDLPGSDPNALVLIDIFSHQEPIDAVLRNLRSRGWRNIVVIAADPSIKESRAVLRQRLGLDYWNKTYEVSIIKSKIEKCLKDMNQVNSID